MFTDEAFAKRLSDIKSAFQKALEDAKTLQQEMDTEVRERHKQIEYTENEIKAINAIEADTMKFISNLEGLV